MFAIDVYAALLTSRQHAEVLTLHETLEAAMGQCRAWIATSPRCTEVTVTGYPLYIQYGTKHDTVRVQHCILSLTEPHDPLTLDLDAAPEAAHVDCPTCGVCHTCGECPCAPEADDGSWQPVTQAQWEERARAAALPEEN